MFFSKRAFTTLRSSLRCSGDNSFRLPLMWFMLLPFCPIGVSSGWLLGPSFVLLWLGQFSQRFTDNVQVSGCEIGPHYYSHLPSLAIIRTSLTMPDLQRSVGLCVPAVGAGSFPIIAARCVPVMIARWLPPIIVHRPADRRCAIACNQAALKGMNLKPSGLLAALGELERAHRLLAGDGGWGEHADRPGSPLGHGSRLFPEAVPDAVRRQLEGATVRSQAQRARE